MGKCGWSAEGFVMRENSDILFNEVKGVNLGREEVLDPYEKEKNDENWLYKGMH